MTDSKKTSLIVLTAVLLTGRACGLPLAKGQTSDNCPNSKAVPERDPSGHLTIYGIITQIGTVANRVFRDSQGRITKTIYYGLDYDKLPDPFPLAGPYSEEMLAVQSIRIHKYDRNGRQIRVEHYTPDSVLSRIMQTKYACGGGKKATVWLRSDQSREYEIRYENGRSTSHLYFDDTGRRLIAVRGAVPEDINLAYGWGQPVDGLACAIAPNKRSGFAKDISIAVTVRNLSGHPAKVVTALPYQTIQMELRDANGDLVPQATRFIEERNEELMRMNNRGTECLQTIAPHQAGHYASGYELTQWYRKLEGGKYHLTVKRRGSGKGFSLTSNTITFNILDRSPSSTIATKRRP